MSSWEYLQHPTKTFRSACGMIMEMLRTRTAACVFSDLRKSVSDIRIKVVNVDVCVCVCVCVCKKVGEKEKGKQEKRGVRCCDIEEVGVDYVVMGIPSTPNQDFLFDLWSE